jgi:hypothetical protein
MDKPTFVSIVKAIVEGFEDPNFRTQMAAAKAAGDVGQLVGLPGQVQARAFASVGLDAETATADFKAAGRQFAADDDVGPMMARMKAALA